MRIRINKREGVVYEDDGVSTLMLDSEHSDIYLLKINREVNLSDYPTLREGDFLWFEPLSLSIRILSKVIKVTREIER